MTKPATCLVAMLSHVVQKVKKGTTWSTKFQTFTLPSLPKSVIWANTLSSNLLMVSAPNQKSLLFLHYHSFLSRNTNNYFPDTFFRQNYGSENPSFHLELWPWKMVRVCFNARKPNCSTPLGSASGR